MRVAVDGDTVLVADKVVAGLRIWRSVDGGRGWSVHSIPVDPVGPVNHIIALLKAGERWLLILENLEPAGEPARQVFSSIDGTEWAIEKGLDLGTGTVIAATRDRDGNLVLIGAHLEPFPPSPQCTNGGNSSTRYACLRSLCAVVWTGSIGKIVRRNLECAISATSPAAVVTLADGRVLIANRRGDLWIRQ